MIRGSQLTFELGQRLTAAAAGVLLGPHKACCLLKLGLFLLKASTGIVPLCQQSVHPLHDDRPIQQSLNMLRKVRSVVVMVRQLLPMPVNESNSAAFAPGKQSLAISMAQAQVTLES